jgi:hypothetical protein
MEEEDENCQGEGEGSRLIDLYRRYVMEESPQRREEALI